MNDPVLGLPRRRDYVERFPNWMRLGDGAALLLVAMVLVGGPLSAGYAGNLALRGWAWLGCGLLGGWALVGLACGRWDSWQMATGRWAMAVAMVFLAWTGLQLIPLPSALVVVVSPPWGEVRDAYRASGLEVPTWMTIAHSPALGREAWHQALAMASFLACVLMLAGRRACVPWLIAMVSMLVLVEGFAGIYTFFFEGKTRAHGPVFNPNHHAALIMAGMPLYFAGLVQWARNSDRFGGSLLGGTNPLLLLHGLGVLALAGWVASLSVSSILIGGTVLLGWLLLESQGHRRRHEGDPVPLGARVVIGGVCAVVVLVAALSLESSRIPEELAGRAVDTRSHLAGGRLSFAEATLAGASASPMTGLGLRGAEHAITRHSRQPTLRTAIWTHNDPVQVVAELGFVGVLLVGGVLVLAGVAVGRDWSRRRRVFDWSEALVPRAAMAGLVYVFLHSLTDFHLRIPLVGFTVLILMALVLRQGALLMDAFRRN